MSYDMTFSGPQRKPVFAGGQGQLDRLLLKIVDGGLMVCIFVVPFLLGGRHALGQAILVTLAVTAALAWTIRQSLHPHGTWRRSAAVWLLAAGVVVLLLQIASLPPSWMDRLAPKTSNILPMWGGQHDGLAGLGTWSQISFVPAATRTGLVLFLAYCLLFWVTVQRIRTVEDVERLLRWCAWSVVAMAAFGLVQFVTSNEKYFWVYEHPYATTSDTAKGGFTNRNHFAHFLALGLGPLIWWVQDTLRKRPKRRIGDFGRSAAEYQILEMGIGLRVLALGVVLFAVLVSLSRGGAIVSFLAALISVGVCYWARALGLKFVLSLTAVALLIAASLTIYGHDTVSERMGELTSTSLEKLDKREGRRTIWKTTLKAIPDYTTLGSGVGSFREVYPLYLQRRAHDVHFSHAENGYLQVALEAGLPGVVLVLIGILVCGFWCIAGLVTASSGRILVCVGAVTAGLTVSVVHSLVDFVWYVPACMAMVAILAACGCRLRQLSRDKVARQAYRITLPRPVGLAVSVLLAVVGTWMIGDRIGPVVAEPHWLRFQMLEWAATFDKISEESQSDEVAEEQAEAAAPAVAGQRNQVSLAAEEKMVSELEEVVRWDPNHARAHLRLAGAYMRLFHHAQQDAVNMMPLGQIRDAAIAAQFPSREALNEWLSRAIGEHVRYLDLSLYHTRRGLTLCPLLGEGYLYLGELCFLEGSQTTEKAIYVDQALKVRPFDGTVLFHAGREAWLTGDFERGLDFWQRSFQAGPMYQRQMIDWIVGRTAPEAIDQEIRFIIEAFNPDLSGLRLMYCRYREIALPEQLTVLFLAHAEKSLAEARWATDDSRLEEAAEYWLEAMVMYNQLEDLDSTIACARNAVQCNPNSYRARYKLGFFLADAGQFTEAEKHLEWCFRRKPNIIPLRNKLLEVKRYVYGGNGFTASLTIPGSRATGYLR